jgi:hypothetical protein
MTLQPLVLALGILAVNSAQQIEPDKLESGKSSAELVHVSNTFHFDVPASFARVAPLFGPEAERGWAGKHWNPEFLYPRPAKDIQGAVFQVQHGSHTSVWVNTLFDLPGGKMQYVAFIDNVAVTTVDVELTSTDASHTTVKVTYARTALQPAANDDVRALGNNDRNSAPDWQKSIEKCLGIESK